MKIRTQFIISTVVLGVILLLVAASVIITNQSVENTHQQEMIAARIERQAYELGYLANDYLLYRESQQADRWESKFASFSSDLSKMDASTPEQQALLARISSNQQRLKAVFTEVRANIESTPQTPDAAFDAKFLQVSWSRLEVQNQAMIFDVSRLGPMLRDREDRLGRVINLLSFVLICLLGGYLWGNAGLTFRRTLKAINGLQAGTRIIGSGNLDFAITVQNEDEIGELSRAFNQMTASLKQVTASKADLEEEATERRRAEEALRRNEAFLLETGKMAKVGGWELDLQTMRLAWSLETYHIHEMDPSLQPELESAISLYAPEATPQIAEAVRRAIEEGQSYDLELPLITAKGRNIWIRTIGNPEFRDGSCARLFGTIQDVTERKQAEEALLVATLQKQASEYARTLIEVSLDPLVTISIDGKIMDVNEATIQATGVPREALVGTNFSGYFTEPQKAEQGYQQVFAEGIVIDFPLTIRHCDGHLMDVLYNATLYKDTRGNVLGAFAAARDMTSLKQAELELKRHRDNLELLVRERTAELQTAVENLRNARQAALNLMEDAVLARTEVENEKRRLEAVMEALPVGVAVLDSSGGSILTNLAYEQIWGGPRPPVDSISDYVAYKAWWVDTGEPVQPEEWASARAVQKGETIVGQVMQIERFEGKRAFVLNSGVPILNEQREIVGSAVAIMDITEQMEAEEALKKAHDELELRVQERTWELSNEIAEREEIERQLRIQTTAMEAAANGIVITDPEGNIQWTNPALTQITGYETSELLGQNTHIFNSGKHDAEYFRQMWTAILSGRVWRGETINRRKDGGLYVEEQTITPVLDEHDEIPHFIAIKQDITKRKRAEEELERRNVELQAISLAEHEQRQLAEALVGAALVLNNSMKLSEILPLILQQIKDVIPYQLANIALLEGESFYEAAHDGDMRWSDALTEIRNRFPLADYPMMSKLRQSGQAEFTPDGQQEPDRDVAAGPEGNHSLLSAPLLVEEKVIGFVSLFAEQPGFFTVEMYERLKAFAAHAAVAIQNAWLFEQVRAGSERLQSLSRRLVEIQESERLYISRELHDEAGQMLTSLLVDLRLLEKRASDPKAILKLVAEMEISLNAVLENLHRIAMALRPASLDHVGLVAALRQHAESIGEKNGLQVSFRAGKVKDRLQANVETVLYRIVQEALTNIVRHAQATRVDVILTVRDNQLIVIVEDDGIGFDPGSIPAGEHLGLFGMRERTEMIGGRLTIESAPGKGTTIMVEVSYVDTLSDRG
jgi:PAS domain S-box-containing protein